MGDNIPLPSSSYSSSSAPQKDQEFNPTREPSMDSQPDCLKSTGLPNEFSSRYGQIVEEWQAIHQLNDYDEFLRRAIINSCKSLELSSHINAYIHDRGMNQGEIRNESDAHPRALEMCRGILSDLNNTYLRMILDQQKQLSDKEIENTLATKLDELKLEPKEPPP